MSDRAMGDVPLEVFRMILREAAESEREARGQRMPVLRQILQWRLVNRTFDDEIMLYIQDTDLLTVQHNWHDPSICPDCHCKAPVESLSAFAASLLLRQRSSGMVWKSNMPALFNHAVDQMIYHQFLQPHQLHYGLKLVYQEILELGIMDKTSIPAPRNEVHRLLPGVHRTDDLHLSDAYSPGLPMVLCIFLGQLGPVNDFLRSNSSPALRSSYGFAEVMGMLLDVAVKCEQLDLSRRILDQGVVIKWKHQALEVAFGREDATMMKLLLDLKYKDAHSEGPRRALIQALIIRSIHLNLNDITNILLDHVEYMHPDFVQAIFGHACYNGNDDLIQRLLQTHRGLEINKSLETRLEWGRHLYLPGGDFHNRFFRPVEVTIRKGHESALRLLLEQGGIIHHGHSRKSPMLLATECGHVGTARVILDAGRRLLRLSPYQWHCVIRRYCLGKDLGYVRAGGFVQLLLETKAIDVPVYVRKHPKFIYDMVIDLVVAKDVAAVKAFATHGMPMHGDFYSPKERKSTPMDIAESVGASELVDALAELGVPRRSSPVPASRKPIPVFHPTLLDPRDVTFRCSRKNCKLHRGLTPKVYEYPTGV
ncbi:hypothetical protein PG987_007424 [Apiospora arundinis]